MSTETDLREDLALHMPLLIGFVGWRWTFVRLERGAENRDGRGPEGGLRHY